LFRETADVSVRPAVPGDEHAMARVQLAAWRQAHADVLGPGVLDALDAEAVTAQWRQAIVAPPGPGYRVLVACDGPEIVGVASVAPVPPPEDRPLEPPGGVLLALEVSPGAQRSGHGSRLLAAAVDLLREDGADQLHTWVLDGDEARSRFLAGAGLGPDEASRELYSGVGPDGQPRVVREHRWSALL